MLPTLPRRPLARFAYTAYVAAFFIYLLLPLAVVAAFAFNDAPYPSLPWGGFTLDWFFGGRGRTGLFQDARLLESLAVSFAVACAVTLAALAIGTSNAFLFERERFPGRDLLYSLMLLPLVIPGVILGVSILMASSSLANELDTRFGWEAEWLRPGVWLVILGQFSFITTMTTLVISARLRKFDASLEEAAMNLGASRLVAVFTITLPYLSPALLGAGTVAFLMSFENFNTTIMLVGSDAPLTVRMFDRLREGATPVLNAMSLLLILGSGLLVSLSLLGGERGRD